MRRINITILITLLMSMMNIKAWADDFLVFDIENGEAAVSIWYDDYPSTVVIPSTVADEGRLYPVTSIRNFGQRTRLTSVYIPNSVKTIEQGAFSDCTSLSSINIPNSVTKIGDWAFEGCISLTSIDIPNSVTTIGDWAFMGCTGLTSIVIPNSLTSLSNQIFYGCTNLSSVTIPNSVTTISESPFYGCTSLSTINLPNSLETIGEYAFDECTWLESLEIPNSVKSIDSRAFRGCTSLASIDIPNSVTIIGKEAFSGCSALSTVNIGNSVTKIDHWAFEGCSALKTIDIPNSVTYLGQNSFKDCKELTTATIGASVETILLDVFWGCDNLVSLKVSEDNPKYDSREDCNAIIWTAKNILCTGCKNTVIPNTVKMIGTSSFAGCTALTSIVIPNSITEIGDAPFEGCSNLTEIVSLIENPFSIVYQDLNNGKLKCSFEDEILNNTTLYVPAGTKRKYEATDGWKGFKTIIEMSLTPVEVEGKMDFDNNSGLNEDTRFVATVIDNVFYNFGEDAGEYVLPQGAIVVYKPTSDAMMSELAGKDLFDVDLLANFTGIAFMLPAGEGCLNVTAKTSGSMLLKVLIVGNDVVSFSLDSKKTVSVPYNISEPTLVFIYAGEDESASAKGMRKVADGLDDALTIYGFSWGTEDLTGIETVDHSEASAFADGSIYNLNGQKATDGNLPKGVYIRNGKKLLVK